MFPGTRGSLVDAQNPAERTRPGQKAAVHENDASSRKAAEPRRTTRRTASALGIEVVEGYLLKVVDENEVLPVTRSVDFLVTDITRPIGVYLGQSVFARDNTLLSTMHLLEPPGYEVCRRAAVRVMVEVTVDVDGKSSVKYRCQMAGRTVRDGNATTAGHPEVMETAHVDEHILPEQPAGSDAVPQPVELPGDLDVPEIDNDVSTIAGVDKGANTGNNENESTGAGDDEPTDDGEYFNSGAGENVTIGAVEKDPSDAGKDEFTGTTEDRTTGVLLRGQVTTNESGLVGDLDVPELGEITLLRVSLDDGPDDDRQLLSSVPSADIQVDATNGAGEDLKTWAGEDVTIGADKNEPFEAGVDEFTGTAEERTAGALLSGQVTANDGRLVGELDVPESGEITSPRVSLDDGPDDDRLLLSSVTSDDIQVDADYLGERFTENSFATKPDSRCNEPDDQYNKPDSQFVEPDGRCDEIDCRRHEPDGQCDEPDGIESIVDVDKPSTDNKTWVGRVRNRVDRWALTVRSCSTVQNIIIINAVALGGFTLYRLLK